MDVDPLTIYKQFHTPHNLQIHMLRVASVAVIILDKWTGPKIDRSAIIQTCLFHDIAKPVTFDMSKQGRFVESIQELEALQKHHDNLIKQFGTDEHHAVLAIFKTIGLSENAQRLINNLEWSYADKLREDGDIESLVPIYSDMRVEPEGIATIEERMKDISTRYDINLEKRLQSALKVELVIKQNTNQDVDTITASDIYNKIIEFAPLYKQ